MLFVMPSIAQSGDTTCIPGLEITNSEDVISRPVRLSWFGL